MTFTEYYKKGVELNGTTNMTEWKFICPCCGKPFTISSVIKAGLDIQSVFLTLNNFGGGATITKEDGTTYRELELYEVGK